MSRVDEISLLERRLLEILRRWLDAEQDAGLSDHALIDAVVARHRRNRGAWIPGPVD